MKVRRLEDFEAMIFDPDAPADAPVYRRPNCGDGACSRCNVPLAEHWWICGAPVCRGDWIVTVDATTYEVLTPMQMARRYVESPAAGPFVSPAVAALMRDEIDDLRRQHAADLATAAQHVGESQALATQGAAIATLARIVERLIDRETPRKDPDA